jgi:hypothetical protein
MKKIIRLSAIVIAALFIGACSEFPLEDDLELKDQVVLNEDGALKTVTDCSSETAWTKGERYVERGNWAMFTEFFDGGKPKIVAGKNMIIGWVEFKDLGDGYVKIIIKMGWCLSGVDEPLKIQGYDSEPTEKPSPGKFTTFKGVPSEVGGEVFVIVPKYKYYGIHMDVGCCD